VPFELKTIPGENLARIRGWGKDDFASTLFRMSSPLPPSMIDIGQSRGLDIRRGARGFAFNADLHALASFLTVGTSIGRSR